MRVIERLRPLDWLAVGLLACGVLFTATGLLPAVSAALVGIRRAKTDAKASQKTEVRSATIAGPAILAQAADDLRAVGRIADLAFVEADEIAVTGIDLVEEPA